MSLISVPFLFAFLPCALVVHSLAGRRLKEIVLLALSLLFYAAGCREYFLLFVVTLCLTVLIGRSIRRTSSGFFRKPLLVLGVLLQLLPLAYYKYLPFALSEFSRLSARELAFASPALPLGISFYTFKAISYLADVYRGRTELSPDPVRDALYLSFFPQLQSGPLSRYENMRPADAGLGARERFAFFSDGALRFMVGFCKKVLLADVLLNVCGDVFAAPFADFSRAYAWLGSISYSMQLYFDFSGYSDMAVGVSKMFGYECVENFDYPYMTDSVSRFWRRWHISLGRWFRDYVYIPMGGSRGSRKGQVYRNLFVVWLLTGLWHGASWTFLWWGLGYFLLISLEKLLGLPDALKRPWARVLWRAFSLFFINLQWIVFRSPSLSSALQFIRRLFYCPSNPLADRRTLFLLRDYRFFLAAALLFCFPVVPRLRALCAKKESALRIFELLSALATVLLFIWALSFVFAGLNNPFAYANF